MNNKKYFNGVEIKRGMIVSVSGPHHWFSGVVCGFQRFTDVIRVKTFKGLEYLTKNNPAQTLEILGNTGETNFGIVKNRFGRNTPQKLPKLKKKKEIVLETVGNI